MGSLGSGVRANGKPLTHVYGFIDEGNDDKKTDYYCITRPENRKTKEQIAYSGREVTG